jgi:O-antigen/teichoic acid export membrane protein
MPIWIRNLITRLLENELVRRVLKNSAYLFSATGISAALSMVQGILAARLLGVAGYGILGAITMFTSVVNKFISFRMNELVIKYVGQYTEQDDQPRAAAIYKAASLVEVTSSVLAYGLVWLLAPIGAFYFAKDAELARWFQIYGLIVLANLMAESSTGLLQIFDRFRNIAIINVAQSALTLGLIAAAFVRFEFLGADGDPMLGVVLAYMAGKISAAVLLTLSAVIEAGRHWGAGWWRTPLVLLRNQARELIHFGVSTNLSATINLVNKDAELLWVSFFRNPTETGYYKLALALANVVQLPVAPMPQATYPELSREVSRANWLNVRYILRQGSLLAGGYTLATTLFLVVLGRPLIDLVYTPEFSPAYPALVILLGGFLVANTFYWNRSALLALGLPEYPMKVNFITALLKVGLSLLLVPTFGYLASAALLSGFYILSISLNVRKARQVLSGKPGLEQAG